MVKEREDSEDLTAKIDKLDINVIDPELQIYSTGGYVWARNYGPGPDVSLCDSEHSYLFLELD